MISQLQQKDDQLHQLDHELKQKDSELQEKNEALRRRDIELVQINSDYANNVMHYAVLWCYNNT